jgi:hypothetical protein
MHGSPGFEYYLYRHTHPVLPGESLWNAPFPISRNHTVNDDPEAVFPEFHLGDYFTAARCVLEKCDFKILTNAVSRLTKRAVLSSQIQCIRICLKKHGEFYHPAKVEVQGDDISVSIVLNVAVSENGVEGIQQEYRALKSLSDKYPFSYSPKVFGIDVHEISGKPIWMFLGEWLEGYHEFHHLPEDSGNGTRIQVWDEKGRFFLTNSQEMELYRQIAHILTLYYNIHTFEEISPWHHAAGDFVIMVDDDSMRIKLISVRKYSSILASILPEKEHPKMALILHALFLFFLNLSIRIRLDRIEGVGEMIWADETAVKGFTAGFFSGLEMKPRPDDFPAPVSDCFLAYLLQCKKTDFDSLLSDMANRYTREASIIQKHLKHHSAVLYESILQRL